MKADMRLQLSRMMTTSMLVCRCSIHVRAERDTRYKLLQSVTKIGGRLLSTSPRSRRIKSPSKISASMRDNHFYGSWSRAKGFRLCSQRTTNSSTEFITAPCSGYPFGFSPILQRFLGEGDDVPAWVCVGKSSVWVTGDCQLVRINWLKKNAQIFVQRCSTDSLIGFPQVSHLQSRKWLLAQTSLSIQIRSTLDWTGRVFKHSLTTGRSLHSERFATPPDEHPGSYADTPSDPT